MNRVEHQKLNQTTAELLFGWSFGPQFDLRQTRALISTTNYFTIVQLLDVGLVISTKQCMYLPKVEVKSKNPTKRWCSTRFNRKKYLSQRRETCRLHSYICGYVVFEQLLRKCQWIFSHSYAMIILLFFSESSWTPKTQPNNSRAAVWLSVWSSTPAFGKHRN